MLVTGHCCWCPGRPAGGAINACSAHRPLDADGQNLHTNKNRVYNVALSRANVFNKLYSCVCVTYEDGMQKQVKVSAPFHFDPVVYNEVSQQDHGNVTPVKK